MISLLPSVTNTCFAPYIVDDNDGAPKPEPNSNMILSLKNSDK